MLPPAQLVGSRSGDGWPLVEGGEHRQRFWVRLQQAGEWAARAADRDERGSEGRIVGKQRGGVRVGGNEALHRTPARRRLG